MTLRPAAGPPGTRVVAKGRNLGSRKRFAITLSKQTLARGRTSRRGTFRASFAIPANADGRLRIVSRAGRRRVSSLFAVIREAASPPVGSATLPAPAPPMPPPVDPLQPPAPTPQPTLPIRAAFYYPWFPEAWNQQGINPFTKYHPTLGYYSSSGEAIRLSHLDSLEYAHFEAGIYSWWGQGHYTDQRFPNMLADTFATGNPIKWTLYQEAEGYSDPTADLIGADLDYIKANYADHPSYLRVDGKPVLFVYARGADACPMADRWMQANTPERDFYIVLKVFAGYRSCTSQPQSWHQYAPSTRADRQTGYSFAISPEFDLTGPEPERLPRDLAAFQKAAADMIASNEPWQLVISFNEWGENTATEPAEEWASASGQGQYLDVLAGL